MTKYLQFLLYNFKIKTIWFILICFIYIDNDLIKTIMKM